MLIIPFFHKVRMCSCKVVESLPNSSVRAVGTPASIDLVFNPRLISAAAFVALPIYETARTWNIIRKKRSVFFRPFLCQLRESRCEVIEPFEQFVVIAIWAAMSVDTVG